MKGTACITLFIFVVGIIKIGYSQEKYEKTSNDDYYKNILLELGAFPYYSEKGHPCYGGKGNLIRLDINGWLSPYLTDDVGLTAEEKARYGYPPTKDRILGWYQKYKSMLSVEEYLKRKDDQYQTITCILLQVMIAEHLPIESIPELIKFLKIKPGHEGMIVRLLSDTINVNDAFDIFLSIGDVIEKEIHLLDKLFPEIKKDDYDCIVKLNEYIENKKNPFYFRWFFLFKLYKMDMIAYGTKFITTSIHDVLSEKDWFKRTNIYRLMLKTKEYKINKAIYKFIERDPNTICRITILMNLDYIDDNIMKVIKKISDGEGTYWHHFDRDMMKLESNKWQDSLKYYINTMMKSEKSKKILKKLREIRNKLDNVRIRKLEDLDWYFKYFKIKEKNQD